MRAWLVALLFFSLVYYSESQPAADCKFVDIKSRWRNSCNWCSCSEKGFSACTRRGCPPDWETRNQASKECEGTPEWRVDCNWCKCDQGSAVCSANNCKTEAANAAADQKFLSKAMAADCEALTQEAGWKASCNSCSCSDSGLAFCTRKFCIDGKHGEIIPASQNECTGKVRWKNSCNTCVCVDGVAVCSLYKCNDDKTVETNATERSCETKSEGRFKNDCNWCSCNAGFLPTCTLLGCLGPKKEKSKPSCTGDVAWTNGCNYCKCVNNESFCSDYDCKGGVTEAADAEFRSEPEQETLVQFQQEVLLKQCETLTSEGSWKSKCNSCTCSAQGLALCTKKLCIDGKSGAEVKSEAANECVGKVRWKDSCNTCECVEGVAVCSLFSCNDDGKRNTENTLEISCKTRSNGRFMKGCNWCTCQKGGSALCTLRGCLPVAMRQSPQCKGDVTFKHRCNYCKCVNDKTYCTSHNCDKESSVAESRNKGLEKNCKAVTKNATFKKECNSCTCSHTGLSFCTRKFCLPQKTGSDAMSTSRKQCDGQVSWKDKCNTCECVDGVAVCSVSDCQTDKGVDNSIVRSCKTSSEGRFQDVCNWCNCGPEGLPSCTKKRCRPGAETERNNPSCSGEVAWKSGCNYCVCVNEETVCTSHNCDISSFGDLLSSPKQNEAESACHDGRSWKEECNTCFCQGGQSFCTRKLCNIAIRETSITDLTRFSENLLEFEETLGSSVCKEGSRWRKGCGWCNCKDGSSECVSTKCSVELQVKLQESSCDEGSLWKEDCNICSCIDGISLCTTEKCGHGAMLRTQTLDLPIQSPPVGLESPGGSPARECKNGSSWNDGCNNCFCSEELSFCTYKTCNGVLKPSDTGNSCDGDSEWRGKSCEWCVCKAGKGVCEPTSDCAQPSVAPPVKKTASPSEGTPAAQTVPQCTKGSNWFDGCNTCHCTDGGFAACTEKYCFGGAKPTDEGNACNGESEWRGKQCEWCACKQEKAVCAATTDCQDKEDASGQHRSCEGESRWKDDCNSCRCVQGKGFCTRKVCNAIDVHPKSEDRCEEGRTWKDDCNTCICMRGRGVCTRKGCRPVVPREDICAENETSQKDCNSCVCLNGLLACTKKLCLEGRSISELSETCNQPAIQADAQLCAGFQSKWTYNKLKSSCESIVYGGCGGTANLFSSEEDCATTCVTPDASARSDLAPSDKPRERCFLPVVPGPCFGLLPRYAYNALTQRCEAFLFGGCQGNQNNFDTATACHEICGGAPPTVEMSCDRTKCDWKRFGHYIYAKECEPVYDGGSCCPSNFICKNEDEQGKLDDRCYYQDKEYAVGDSVPVEDPCQAGCRCTARSKSVAAGITCANIECPSLFRRQEPGCRYLYTPGQCCSNGTECSDPKTPTVAEPRNVGCTWKGRSWKLGSQIYFDEDPCQKCICTSEFTDPKGPGCEKLKCGYDFRYRLQTRKGCSPIFFEQKCCSIDWICPGDERLLAVIENPESQQEFRSGECVFGNMTVPVGSSVNMSDCNLKCACRNPPELTCTQYRSCEMAEQSDIPKDEGLNCPSVKCSAGCSKVLDRSTGCQKCFCAGMNFKCPEKPTCPPKCLNPTIEFDESIGCRACNCQCRKDSRGLPNCPMDCVTKLLFNEETGCQQCVCDSSKSGRGFWEA